MKNSDSHARESANTPKKRPSALAAGAFTLHAVPKGGQVEDTECQTLTLDSRNHSGAGHHSSPGNHANSQVDEDAHASAAVHWLNSEVLGHRIDKLVVFAPARTLGEVRKHYHKQTEAALLKEVAKDLVGRKPTEILAALRENH